LKFTRITFDPRQMGGMPCIRALRIPVATVVGMIADGMTESEILGAYPDLERDDIHEALRCAADALRERASFQSYAMVHCHEGGSQALIRTK
jgi:uncharacterized protein (DUF433 family)